jgi:hypothetical protein
MELAADHERAECHTSAAEMDVAWGSICPDRFEGVDASVGYRRQGGRANGEAIAFQSRKGSGRREWPG